MDREVEFECMRPTCRNVWYTPAGLKHPGGYPVVSRALAGERAADAYSAWRYGQQMDAWQRTQLCPKCGSRRIRNRLVSVWDTTEPDDSRIDISGLSPEAQAKIHEILSRGDTTELDDSRIDISGLSPEAQAKIREMLSPGDALDISGLSPEAQAKIRDILSRGDAE